MQELFSKDTIDNNIIKRFDMYLKQTCINTLKNQCKAEKRKEALCMPIYEFETSLEYIEEGFERAEADEIEVIGYRIKISNYKLFSVISVIPEKLKAALILNVVADISLKEIAKMLGVSERTVKNYKSSAIEKIRRYMDSYEG